MVEDNSEVLIVEKKPETFEERQALLRRGGLIQEVHTRLSETLSDYRDAHIDPDTLELAVIKSKGHLPGHPSYPNQRQIL